MSSNVRGIRDANKRGDMWLYFQEMKADIVCLQETHLIDKDIHNLKLEWNIEYILGGNSTNSKGVAILINNTFEYQITEFKTDQEGRYIILNLLINNLIPIQIINIYGCNNDNPEWFTNLFNIVDKQSADNVIITGDWNTALSEKDTYNYQFQRNIKSRNIINSYIEKNKYIDIWRDQNKDQKRFTWGTKKPFKKSRLDYFIISEDILTFNPKSEINTAYRSDHNTISLKLNVNSHPRGKGSWKLNNNLLTNKDYINLVKDTINLVKHTYALPIYSTDFINKDHGETLEINIDNDLFLNTLLCQRGETITFSKRLTRNKNKPEKDLISQILMLEVEIDDKSVENENKIKDLDEAKLRLEQLREEKLKGNQIRSRYLHTKDWEKPSKYFLNLEKKNFLNKNINELKNKDDKIINNPNEILKMQAEFYSNLFSSKNVNIEQHTRYNHLLDNIPRINRSTKERLNKPIEIKELEIAIKNSKMFNKALGPDGFSNELFKMFNLELKHWLFRVYQEALNRKYLNKFILEGTITYIPKAGKSRDSLKNWRPLTLLNSVYKFYSTIISNRIKSTLIETHKS